MRGRRLAPLAGLAALGACAAAPEPGPLQAATRVSACPQHVIEAEAWVNRMAGTGTSPRQLVVSARMADASATALLLRSDASTPQQLVLDIRAAAAAPLAGRLAYREPAPETLYSRILLRCGGADDHIIPDIASVF